MGVGAEVLLAMDERKRMEVADSNLASDFVCQPNPKKNKPVPTSVWVLIVGIRLLSIFVLVQPASLCYRYGFLATATMLSLNLNPRSKPKLTRCQVILGLPGIPPTPEK